ncbi:hypothetical protein Cyast_1472 [Cyanobacterium stanieri PCC 7202]|uniref:Uncharacterized protein n=1 Tax=Cyanobacterium stanieri (strain ATCC 29140 / PCC 7202) TaxID=292563 RepID=K9YM17_CYASC|nr:hypothetical protein Cyast_1472 [Cyanobacterium stanieri PCC 7202]
MVVGMVGLIFLYGVINQNMKTIAHLNQKMLSRTQVK